MEISFLLFPILMRIYLRLAFGLLSLGLSTPAFCYFSDVPSTHINAEAIVYVKAEGIVQGYSDGTYRPNNLINRAEFAKILEESIPDAEDGVDLCFEPGKEFSDVFGSEWYWIYVCMQKARGIVNGYPDGSFRPGSPINFVDAAKMLHRSRQLDSRGIYVEHDPASDPWFRMYVEALSQAGAIPMTIDDFGQSITRGEMAEMIYRLKTNNVSKPSKSYEEIARGGAYNNVHYEFISSSEYVTNYDSNLVLAYSITAPRNADAEINGQSFMVEGGRWSNARLHISSVASYSDAIDTWTSDDDWTESSQALFSDTLSIPAGQTRYLRLIVDIGTPADQAVITVKHSQLPLVTLPVKY